MEKLKFLRVQFDTEIAPYEIPAFRGAIASKVGRDSVLYHNHLDDKTFRYGYPLIQYKRVGKQPTILCIGDGVDEIHKFFENSSWNVTLSNRELDMKIAKLDMHQFTMQVWEKDFTYKIFNWIALNQEGYKEYNKLDALADKILFLEKKLTGNILSLAKGINWTVQKEIRTKIIDLGELRPVRVKGIRMMAFNPTFKTNVFLPNFIGLGGKVSLGFGTVKEVRRNKA